PLIAALLLLLSFSLILRPPRSTLFPYTTLFRSHGHRVAHAAERRQRRGADPLGGRLRRDQFGMVGLELDELAHERVVLGVGDGRRILDVIAHIVLFDLGAQLRGPLRRFAAADRFRHYANTRCARGLPAGSPAWSSCPNSTCSRSSMTVSAPSTSGLPWSSTSSACRRAASSRPTSTMRPKARGSAGLHGTS